MVVKDYEDYTDGLVTVIVARGDCVSRAVEKTNYFQKRVNDMDIH